MNHKHILETLARKVSNDMAEIIPSITKALIEAIEQERAETFIALVKAGHKEAAKWYLDNLVVEQVKP